jgi:hypothetical protein
MVTDFPARIAAVRDTLSAARQSNSGTNYELLAQQLTTIESLAREAVQAAMSGQYSTILHNLENNIPLTPEQFQWLELIIVGEAEQALKYEAEVAGWQEKLDTLFATLDPTGADDTGANQVEKLLQLHALCREAAAVVNRIGYFYQEKERAESFRRAISSELTPEARQLLADVIRAMMTSNTM